MKKKDLNDIHFFLYNLLKELCWVCPRTNKTSIGAFFDKNTLTPRRLMFERKKVTQIVKIWQPTFNMNFIHQDQDVHYWYKHFLFNQLSFRCNFREIIIPDGGYCCDWIAVSILLSENGKTPYC